MNGAQIYKVVVKDRAALRGAVFFTCGTPGETRGYSRFVSPGRLCKTLCGWGAAFSLAGLGFKRSYWGF